ncbi:LytR/AlgR family response regulator transcription factor [Flavivirga eckloniae]|uniref:HTH LytTR-type domain-containing protein n=1 Tax=Flavivirga eckloniae TaxID=1803846 RepID=A0A2K9PT30_9FLAO|nr:LytTR family DNA-binding domain-containing protein [Flavivirga eckloniae]AUP79968.1 hypothetical protein C1H87_15160 [Flavivirga eckloniae]
MRILLHVLFWIFSSFLIVFFIGKKGSLSFTLAFTGFLLPVVITISYLFNYWLFPQYLFKKQLFKFVLYGLLVVVLSVYLETLIVLWALVNLGNYSFNNMTPASHNIEQLAVALFFVVFLSNLIYLVRRWSVKEKDSETLIQFRSNRETVQLSEKAIDYIESLGDYVKIHSEAKVFTSREKISKLENRLPSNFIRVHRSYLINTSKIESFNNTKIEIQGNKIPISRKYKPEVLEKLKIIK